MSNAHSFILNEEDKHLFKDVVFLVEATSNEQFLLWEKHNKSYVWQQITTGQFVTIGTLDNRPINVDISYAIICGKKISFYEGISQLVDHKMIEDWLRYHTSHIIYGGRWARCNATNFHNCLRVLRD